MIAAARKHAHCHTILWHTPQYNAEICNAKTTSLDIVRLLQNCLSCILLSTLCRSQERCLVISFLVFNLSLIALIQLKGCQYPSVRPIFCFALQFPFQV